MDKTDLHAPSAKSVHEFANTSIPSKLHVPNDAELMDKIAPGMSKVVDYINIVMGQLVTESGINIQQMSVPSQNLMANLLQDHILACYNNGASIEEAVAWIRNQSFNSEANADDGTEHF
jgi:hypothetical protein